MSEDIIYVGEEDFQEKVLDSDLPVVVDFWAPWCAPCKIVEPVIEELAAEMEGKVRFAKVNTDENQNLAGGDDYSFNRLLVRANYNF